MNVTFSILQHDRKWLVVKHPVAGAPLVVCECYLEHYARTIADLLVKAEAEKQAGS